MKYKRGDTVKIKPLKWFKDKELTRDEWIDIGPGFIPSMKDYCGKFGVIKRVDIKSSEFSIYFHDGGDFQYIEDWIEGKVVKINIHLKQMKSEI